MALFRTLFSVAFLKLFTTVLASSMLCALSLDAFFFRLLLRIRKSLYESRLNDDYLYQAVW